MQNTRELYACCYKEVITILCFLPDEDWNKIPKEKKDFYFKCMDRDYNFDYDFSKPLDKQKLLEPTKAILANIFKKYLATDEEKINIIESERQEYEKIEAEKREKYPVENIFKKKEDDNNNEEIDFMPNNLPISVVKSKTFFEKIIDFLKRRFK